MAIPKDWPFAKNGAFLVKKCKSPAKKTTKKSPARKSPTKKTTKKSPARKSPAKKTTRKSPARKSPAKKTTRKSPARKSSPCTMKASTTKLIFNDCFMHKKKAAKRKTKK